jgi:hypothetical protein
MKKFKMALSLILSAIVIFSSIAIGGMFASADDAVTYEFDSSTGTLTISGTGEVTQSGISAKVTDSNALKSVVINDGITSIGDYAFECFDSLTTVTMTDSVTTIGDYVFYKCYNLAALTLSKNLTSVGEEAFEYCSSLSELYIPKGLGKIGEYAFYGLDSLKIITVDPDNKILTVEDGVLFNTDKTDLILYPACKEGNSYKVPDTVTTICESAFYSCNNLKEIIIPDTVKHIGQYAFENCTNLKKINIPKSLSLITEGMFYGCKSLESIAISNSEIEIDEYAFYGCDNIKYEFFECSIDDLAITVINKSTNEGFFEDNIVTHFNSTGHTFDTEGKCTVEGCDYVCDHTDNANKFICTEDYICSVCKKKLSSATTHSFDANGKCTKSECGYVCDHADNTNKATCEKSAICSICKKELPKLGHDFSGSPTETKATFFKDGSKVYHCTHDGCIETRTEITLSTINRILAWFRNIFSFKF